MTRRVELRPAARKDLDRLVAFMAALDERSADRREQWLRRSLHALGCHPFKGRPHKGRETLREFTLRHGKSSYLVRYEVSDDVVRITRIWHGKEDR
ncbi:MAG: type II toxin-antitoxin system RelE/ParE family toxin [Hyphomonadaceae bacterium]